MFVRNGGKWTQQAFLKPSNTGPNDWFGSRAALSGDGARWPLPRHPFLLETSRPGVFAAGDVRLASLKRVASAVGEGSSAVSNVHLYLETM